ncbi:MAG: DNA primase [Myxococcales bacterium]|nr:DNA primase [Myxococcales bacterium]
MSIPRHVVDEVRARTDIVQVIGQTVTLRRRGTSHVGLCPFHNEKTGSFNVVPSKQIYHCFGCGAGGDVFTFLQKSRGVGFLDAVKELAAQVGVTIEERALSPQEEARISRRKDLHETAEAACRWYEATLLVGKEGAPGRAYLVDRGISLDTARKYRLGFAPEGWNNLETHLTREGFDAELMLRCGLVKKHEARGTTYDVFRGRLLFPIHDDRGRPIAFGGRVLPGAPKDSPKYLNSPGTEIYEKSRILYGLSYARSAVQRKDRLLVVEGYFDAVSLWQAGFEEAVAPCGTSLTVEHLEIVRRLTTRVVALFDTDEAGINAAVRALDLFLAAGVEARRLDLPGAKDPDEYIQKYGGPAFEERLERTEPLLELVIRRTLDKHGSSSEGRGRAVAALAPTLRKLVGTVRDVTIRRAAGWLGIPEEELIREVGRARGEDAPSPTPGRWAPDKDLAHLLWLVVHYPERVAPGLAEVDPSVVSDRSDVLGAIARLLLLHPLASVLAWAEIDAPDLARVLAAAAANSDLYTLEASLPAARSILARLHLRSVEARILTINREIHRCETTGDKSSYGSLVRDLSALYAQQAGLKQSVNRRAGVVD